MSSQNYDIAYFVEFLSEIEQAVPLYLSEIAPYKIRGAVNQLFQLTTCLGILVADVVNYFTEKIHPWGWRLSLGLAVVPATLIFVGGFFLPETPNSLVEQGRLDEARKILEKVYSTKQSFFSKNYSCHGANFFRAYANKYDVRESICM